MNRRKTYEPGDPVDQERKALADRLAQLRKTMTRAQAADRVGVSDRQAKRLLEDRSRGNKESMKTDASGPRCRCGLRLPCNNCIPSIREMAERGVWGE